MKRYKKILIEDYKKLFEGKKQAVTVLRKALKKYTDDDIKQVVDDLETRDPTSPKNKYIELLARVFVNLYENYINRRVHVVDILSNFDDLYNSNKVYKLLTEIEKRNKTIPDMQKIKGWQEFLQIITKISQEKTKTQLKRGSLSEFKKGKDYIEIKTKNKEFDFYIPLNWEVSKKLASTKVGKCEGKWCISYQKEEGYWNSYSFADERAIISKITPSVPFASSVKESLIFVFIISKTKQEFDAFDKIAMPFVVKDGSINHSDIRDALDRLTTAIEIKNLIGSESYNDILGFIRSNIDKVHDLCLKNLQEKYNFDLKTSVNWIEKANTLDATYVSKKYTIIWKDGIWKNGTWVLGTWKNGVWENGVWENGTWEDGTWRDGTWEDGEWRDGIWEKGEWIDGIWVNGLWRDGEWHKGEWDFGTWKDGEWGDGEWKNGIWENGEWLRGYWREGIWKNGTWKKGLIYSKKFNTPIESHITPKEFYDIEERIDTLEELKKEVKK